MFILRKFSNFSFCPYKNDNFQNIPLLERRKYLFTSSLELSNVLETCKGT